MSHLVEHHSRPSLPPAPALPPGLHLSDNDNFGVMELAENRPEFFLEDSFTNFVPPQYLLDGWMLVVEGRNRNSLN